MRDDAGTDVTSAIAYPPRRAAIFACVILFLGYLLAFADRTIVALLVVPIERDLGLSDVQMGLLQGTAFAIFYAIFGLPIAWAVDRFNRRSIVAAGIASWSLMTCLAGLSRSFTPFFLARVGVGAGEATILPAATSLFADYFPPASRGRALGVFASGIYFGSGLAFIGGGLILRGLGSHHFVVPVFGTIRPWQVVLLSVGLLGLPLALVAGFMREPPRRHHLQATAATARAHGLRASLRHDPAALSAHIVGFTAMAFASFAATAWLPTIFIRDHGWSIGEVGTHFGLLTIVVGPIGSFIGGFLADLLERRAWQDGKFVVAALAALGAIAPALMLGLSTGAGSAFLGAALVVFFTSFVWGLAPGALQEIIHGSALGRVTAIYTAVLNLVGLGLGPAAVALLAHWSFHGDLGPAMAVIVPAACVVALVAFLAGRPAYRRARTGLEPAASPLSQERPST